MVPPASHRTFVSHGTREQNRGVLDFGYKVFTFFDCLFQGILLSATLPCLLPHNPRSMRLRTMTGFGLFRFRSPLLTESRLISFPHLTEMFQFRWCPAHRYVDLSIAFTMDFPDMIGDDFSIRKPPDKWSMAPTRRVSPPYASFLGMNTQGIHCQLVALQRTKAPIYIGTCSFSTNCFAVFIGNLPIKSGWITPYDATTSCTVLRNFTFTVQSLNC